LAITAVVGLALLPTAAMAQTRNLAVGATASQSTTDWGGPATRAQDNDTDGNYGNSSTSHTMLQAQPWWHADLGSVNVITQVAVWNRSDCCMDRLTDYWVFVSNNPFNLSLTPAVQATQPGVWSSHQLGQAARPTAINLPANSTGRYVMVQLSGTNYLTISEVQVFGNTQLPAIDAQAFVANNNFGLFLHFGLGTMVNAQWADPNTSPSVFNPASLNADQWAIAAQSAGMKYGVLTAKHHDGFALWPTAYSTYSLAASPYQGGGGDIVGQYTSAFRSRGLRVGLYFSIWDRHNGQTTELIKNQLRELLTHYGHIDYIFFDGWGWQIPYTSIPYQPIRDFIRQVSPGSLVVANNDHQSSLSTTDLMEYEISPPPNNSTPKETCDVLDVDQTWFYTNATGAPKSAASIISTLTTYNSYNSSYLLNVGPTTTGLISQPYLDRLTEIGGGSSGPVATQSSTGYGGDAGRAIDGNTDGVYNNNSTTHTNSTLYAWWQVDLRSSRNISSVKVWNRTDCCADRLSDYWVFVSNTPFNTSKSPAQQAATAGVWSSHQTTQAGRPTAVTLPAFNGRYVMIQLAGTNYLSLSEVQAL